jgi:hypothetical protein
MKKLKLLPALFVAFSLNAQQECIDYVRDEWPDFRYTVQMINTDSIVIDTKTNLMWKQCTEGLSGINCIDGTLTSFTWQQTLAVPENINGASGYAGFNDWRLPNLKELNSLVARNCNDPSINESIFPNNPGSSSQFTTWIWSASPIVENDNNRSWIVDFSVGSSGIDFRIFGNFVRLVRNNN